MRRTLKPGALPTVPSRDGLRHVGLILDDEYTHAPKATSLLISPAYPKPADGLTTPRWLDWRVETRRLPVLAVRRPGGLFASALRAAPQIRQLLNRSYISSTRRPPEYRSRDSNFTFSFSHIPASHPLVTFMELIKLSLLILLYVLLMVSITLTRPTSEAVKQGCNRVPRAGQGAPLLPGGTRNAYTEI